MPLATGRLPKTFSSFGTGQFDATQQHGQIGAGESEAISLAIEVEARLLLLDDLAARRIALGLHLPIVGTLGLLLAAKRKGLLAAVKPCLDQLLSYEFRVSTGLYDRVLRDAGEAPAATND